MSRPRPRCSSSSRSSRRQRELPTCSSATTSVSSTRSATGSPCCIEGRSSRSGRRTRWRRRPGTPTPAGCRWLRPWPTRPSSASAATSGWPWPPAPPPRQQVTVNPSPPPDTHSPRADTGVPAPLIHAHVREPSMSPTCVAPGAPRFEHRTESGPVLGIGSSTPRLSWTVPRAHPLWTQTAYEVEVTRNGIPQTYLVDGAEQVLVPWPAPPLTSRERAEVRVRVACAEQWSDWGQTAVVEAGLFDPADWSGRFITPDGIGGEGERAPILSGVLDVPGAVRS